MATRISHLCLLFGTVLFILVSTQITAAQGGGPAGSYTTTTCGGDMIIRNHPGNLFVLIEGAFGALVMVVLGAGALIAAALRRFKVALWLFAGAAAMFCLRSLVSLFFGMTYADYNG